MVTLLAFGRRGYAAAAANMIASIRYHGYAGPIHLHVGRALRPVVDEWISDSDCTKHELPDEYANDPGWCKVNLYNIFQGKDTLYLDVDGICLKDLTPLIDQLRADGRSYLTSVMGKGKVGDTIRYFEWAKPEKVAAMHGLNEATFYGIQSSWAYFKRGDWMDTFAEHVTTAWGLWSVHDLKNTWGKGKPDELFYSIACTLMDHDPSFDHAVFFGEGFDPLPQIREKFYILSMYGVGRGRGSVPPRYVQCYEGECRTIQLSGRKMHNVAEIRRDKYANFKT